MFSKSKLLLPKIKYRPKYFSVSQENWHIGFIGEKRNKYIGMHFSVLRTFLKIRITLNSSYAANLGILTSNDQHRSVMLRSS
jgi:hypothetical protein